MIDIEEKNKYKIDFILLKTNKWLWKESFDEAVCLCPFHNILENDWFDLTMICIFRFVSGQKCHILACDSFFSPIRLLFARFVPIDSFKLWFEKKNREKEEEEEGILLMQPFPIVWKAI